MQRQLAARGETQLAAKPVAVGLYRAGAQMEGVGDLAYGVALSQEPEHLELAVAQALDRVLVAFTLDRGLEQSGISSSSTPW